MKELIVADGLEWLKEHKDVGGIITSLPDYDEVDMDYDTWYDWFSKGIRLCLESTSEHSYAIFYQTDRKLDGRIISKSHMVIDQIIRMGYKTVWHKVALRAGVGKVDLYRPGFTHMIAASKKGKSGKSVPDVIERGPMLYKNGMGMVAAQLAIDFVGRSTDTIVDPFCGRGTVPVTAENMGYNAIGVDIDPKQIEYAKQLNSLKGLV